MDTTDGVTGGKVQEPTELSQSGTPSVIIMHIFSVMYGEVCTIPGSHEPPKAGFPTGFFIGGGGHFWNSEIDIKHILLGVVWKMFD